ncbi:UbiA family prenyltransferase [Marinoscillum furvescens]|uniref:1,4-dihydroxy-2-naphthoate octaprenyltransferase n=1 Tax=Marinoscillum furvescens DSM 4134 TaxID=1122208 RepID=A0A3D9L5K7_MARFU|nr:UbiA family prenyltransferase [Marinoscillum furvescens]REE00394.1 1,4-dihydroxy-2-naphthoate octaprenyltransferase [Marinoscillum furvescens DSM 4134]
MKKSTFLHLRFPFSFFLLPVFLFAAAVAVPFSWSQFVWLFVILHLLLYPASNGYNSYFDKDEGSIGGLKNPPKVSPELFYVSWIMDLLAIAIGWLVFSWQLALMLLIYGMMSKAYSHPMVRLKKRPVLGWIVAGVFQGYFTLMMSVMALQGSGFSVFEDVSTHLAGGLSTLLLFGSYPMTQIYQHAEDKSRGDITLSLKLGIRGTFVFTAAFFTLSVALFYAYLSTCFVAYSGFVFVAALLPVLIYFTTWFAKVLKDAQKADYTHTMRLNLISSCCLNAFFLWLIFS